MSRFRDPRLVQKTPGAKPTLRTLNLTNRPRAFKVHAPRVPADPEDFARFVDQLNASFGHVSDELGKIPRVDVNQFVPRAQLDQLLDARLARAAGAETSEASGDTDTALPRSSRRRKKIENAVNAALANAIPTAAPPAVSPIASAVGTTTNPVLFALSDHTHLDTLTGTSTYTIPSSFTLPTGAFSLYANHRILTGSQRITAQGNGRITGV